MASKTLQGTPLSCTCLGCEALRARYDPDSELLRLYARKLLIPGWAGTLDEAEQVYVAAHCAGRGTLRAILTAADLLRGPRTTVPGAEIRGVMRLATIRRGWAARKRRLKGEPDQR